FSQHFPHEVQKDISLIQPVMKNEIKKSTNTRNTANQRRVLKRRKIKAVDRLFQFGSSIASSKQGGNNCACGGACKIDKLISCLLNHRNCPDQPDTSDAPTLKYAVYFELCSLHTLIPPFSADIH